MKKLLLIIFTLFISTLIYAEEKYPKNASSVILYSPYESYEENIIYIKKTLFKHKIKIELIDNDINYLKTEKFHGNNKYNVSLYLDIVINDDCTITITPFYRADYLPMFENEQPEQLRNKGGWGSILKANYIFFMNIIKSFNCEYDFIFD